MIQTPQGKKAGVILCSSSSAHGAIRVAYDFTSTPEEAVTKTALLLRNLLKNVDKMEVSEPPTLQQLLQGEATPPDLMSTFFIVLYCGPNVEKHSPAIKRRANSSSQDALFIVNNGRIKPPKHITLGMAIKSN